MKPSERIIKQALIHSSLGEEWLTAQIIAVIDYLDEQWGQEQKDRWLSKKGFKSICRP